ncbi:MAG TPA: hypothetical protein VMC78_00925 [Mycobacterium sp.]|nr:hypothetical protein [Mycobacterium sp.]
MVTVITVATVAITGCCLWVRRRAWGHRFELGGSIVAASMFLCVLLMGPALSLAVSTPIHAVTGLWNLEDLLGHLVYLAGLTALFHTLVYRITLDEPERFLRRHLEIPMAIMLPLLVGLFIVGTLKEHYPDLFQAPVTGWMSLYWAALCAAAGYLLVNLLRLLRVVRRDPRSTVTANIYITAISIDSGCCASILVSRVIPGYPSIITWVLLCVAACGYAAAPGYSWYRKTRWVVDPVDPVGLPVTD